MISWTKGSRKAREAAGLPQVSEAVEQFEVAEVGKGCAARVEALLKAFRAQQGAQ